jgi:L-aspartate oxidase
LTTDFVTNCHSAKFTIEIIKFYNDLKDFVMEKYSYDFVIVGAGLAGLYSAMYASHFGRVAVITKTTLDNSNSYWAQGGIAAAVAQNDSPLLHYEDTIKVGRNLCNEEAVKILVTEGKERVEELINLGMPFDKENGKIVFGLEGGHSIRRVLHASGDATGKELVNFVLKLIQDNKNITIIENTLVHNLIADDNECFGVYAYDFDSKKDLIINSKATIIASGGGSAIYSRSTNPHTSIAEGIVLAYNAGVKIESMEFIQFHPTAFYYPNGETFLISEAVRGEGAYLVNSKNERFLQDHYMTELSPRDVVSEAIFHEMIESGKPNVFLKLDHLNPEKIITRFPTIYHEALKYGIDIIKDPVPVAPAAHFMVGGIKTGLNAETNIQRLYAAGEVASTGVHGANRLASNSLLECIVYGKRAVDHALSLDPSIEYNFTQNTKATFKVDNTKEQNHSKLKEEIANLLWINVGIVRTANSLKFALNELNRYFNFEFDENEYFSSREKCLILIAELITRSALLREESRGCHLRKDFPDEKEAFRKLIVHQQGKESLFVSN